jgi:cytoskeletal protein CcmA (bactofilin family)
MIHLSDSAKRVLAFIAVLVLVATAGAAVYATLFQPAPPEAADAWGVRGGQVFPQEANFRGPVNVHNASDLTLYNASATPVVVIDGAAGDVDLAGTLTVPSLVTTTTDLTLTGDLLANTATITGAISAADLTASDDLVVGDDATITGTLALGDLSIGGGYGTTGCTVSAAGVLQCDGAATVASASMAGALAADSGTFTGTVSAADLTASDDLVVGDDATITGTLTFGANNLYPLGFGTDGYQMVLGSSTVTTTTVITHGLTTPLYGFCTMSGSLTDNEEQKCSVGISGADVTAYVWKEDGTAGDSGVAVFWQVFGTP